MSSVSPERATIVERVQLVFEEPTSERAKGKRAREVAQAAMVPARIARMLAFAWEVREAVEAGAYRDFADAAKHLGVSRARLSQLMDLTLLAPDIQEELLAMRVGAGKQRVNERKVRVVAQRACWIEQREKWKRLRCLTATTTSLPEALL